MFSLSLGKAIPSFFQINKTIILFLCQYWEVFLLILSIEGLSCQFGLSILGIGKALHSQYWEVLLLRYGFEECSWLFHVLWWRRKSSYVFAVSQHGCSFISGTSIARRCNNSCLRCALYMSWAGTQAYCNWQMKDHFHCFIRALLMFFCCYFAGPYCNLLSEQYCGKRGMKWVIRDGLYTCPT